MAAPSRVLPYMALTKRRLGPYEILSEIARGGMGIVYRARDTRDEKLVAVKVMLAGEDATAEMVKRFSREAGAARELSHPNIVAVLDEGADEGHHFFVMEYVDGRSLDQLIDAGEITPRRSMEMTRKIADALGHAHERGIIHRDIKPSNILIDKDGEPHITDFGLAKNVEMTSKITKTGTCIGTPQYMPPEQAQGDLSQIDPRSDLYSLGVVLYEMFTYKTPFEADTPSGIIYRLMTEDPVPPRRFNLAVDRSAETVCLKLLEKDPNRRYQTAVDLLADVDCYLAGKPIAARPPSSFTRMIRKVRRGRGRIALAGVATGLLMLVGIPLLSLVTRAHRDAELERQRAERQALFDRIEARRKDLAGKKERVSGLLQELIQDPQNHERRVRILTRALRVAPEWPEFQMDRASALFDWGFFGESLDEYARLAANEMARPNESLHATFLRGLIRRECLGDRAGSQEEFEAVVKREAAEATPPAGPSGAEGEGEGPKGHAALSTAILALSSGDAAKALATLEKTRKRREADPLSDDVLPWEEAYCEGLAREAAGDRVKALEAYQGAVKSKYRRPTFFLGLWGLARAARAIAEKGDPKELPGRPVTGPQGEPLFTKKDPWEQALESLQEAVVRTPTFWPARKELRDLLTVRIEKGAGESALKLPEALLARARLSLSEGLANDALEDLAAVGKLDKAAGGAPPREGTEPVWKREGRFLEGLSLWSFLEDRSRARALIEPLAKDSEYWPEPEKEPKHLAERALAILDDDYPDTPEKHLLTGVGRWAGSYLKAHRLSRQKKTREALDEYGHFLQEFGAWPPALVERAQIRLEELRRRRSDAGTAEFHEREAAKPEIADERSLREHAAREIPALSEEQIRSEPVAPLRARVVKARYEDAVEEFADRVRRDLDVCLAVAPSFPRAALLRAELHLVLGETDAARQVLAEAERKAPAGHPATAEIKKRRQELEKK